MTLQALYQPPYSPYGVLSLCLPLGVDKGEVRGEGERTNRDAQNWIRNGSKAALYISSTSLVLLTLLISSLSSACIQMGLFSAADRRTDRRAGHYTTTTTINARTRVLLNHCATIEQRQTAISLAFPIPQCPDREDSRIFGSSLSIYELFFD